MNILAIDTSSNFCSASIKTNDLVVSKTLFSPKNHNIYILAIISNLVKQANIEKDEINILSYGDGPGSTAGIRISYTILQAISVSLNIPVIKFSSMYAAALNAYKQTNQKNIQIIFKTHSKRILITKYTLNPVTKKFMVVSSKKISSYTPNNNKESFFKITNGFKKAQITDTKLPLYLPETKYMFGEIIRIHKHRKIK